MSGLRVGIVGAGGVGIATAGSIIMQGLAGRVTLYDRSGDRARGEALDYLHALPLLPQTEIRGRSFDEFEPEDVMVVTVGHHIQPGESRLDVLDANVEILTVTAEAMEAGGLSRVVIVVSNPLDVLTEFLTRRWAGHPVSVMGSGTSLDTLRFGERLANACGVHPRSIHAWVIGEHGDSSVFLFSSATIGALPLVEYAAQRSMELTPEWFARIEQDVRTAAYRVRELRGSPRHGIGLTVSGLVRCIGRENGTIIPVSVRVADGLCASLPCSLGPDGASAPLWPVMNAEESAGWEQSLDVLRKVGASLPPLPPG
jgi:L-lactate dehydrogenase